MLSSTPLQRPGARLLPASLIAAAGLFAATLLPAPLGAQQIALPVGSEAPGAEMQDLDGNPVQLADYMEEGKATLIEFWATWCGVCRRLQPQMDEIQSTYGDRINVVAVAVAIRQTPEDVKAHLERANPGYPHLWDGRGNAVRGYEVPGTGIVVIVDGSGTVVYTGSGAAQDLVGEVEKILGR